MQKNNDYLKKIGMGFGRLGEWIFDHRWTVVIFYVFLIAISLYFAGKLHKDNSFDSYFDKNDPTFTYYKNYQKDFGSDELSYILYNAPDKPYGPFDIDVMKKIAHLTEALENEVPFVSEVTSLANVEFIEAKGDTIEIHELLLDFPKTQAELLKTRDIVMKKPIYIGGLISKDATNAAIVIEMTRSSADPAERLRLDPKGGDGMDNLYPQVSDMKIREILARPEYQGIKYYYTGDVPMNTTYNKVLGSETGSLTLWTFLVVGIILILFFGKWFVGFIGPLMLVLLSLVFTVGFMGLMGYPMDVMFLMTPTMLTAIGVAQSIHILAEFKHNRAIGLERREAIKQTLVSVAVPSLVCATTTAAGFFSMAGSPLEALSEFAIFGGAGVLFAFGISITLLIVFLSFGKNAPAPEKEHSHPISDMLQRFLHWLVSFNLKHSRIIIIAAAAMYLLSFAGISQLRVAFNFLEEFKEHTEIRKTLTYVQNAMGGLVNLAYVFDTGQTDGIKNSEVLKQVEKLQAYADKNKLVKKTYSIVDTLKDMNQSFHGGDPAYYKLPEDRNLIAQYLLMYEMSGGKELEDYVTKDYSRTVLELRTIFTDSDILAGLVKDMQDYMDKNQIKAAKVELTGIGYLWVKMADYIASSQTKGYFIAILMIICFLIAVFRSVKVGLLAMIPNLLPVFMTLGAMGWMGMNLDYFRVMIATVAIGISVDDTVHLVTRMRMEFLRCGNYREAADNSIKSVGNAVIIFSVVLFCSFLVYLSSQLAVLASFGVILAITVFTAMIADLFLTPVIIYTFKPFGKEFQVE
ncbi:MAG: MMPL family transporter [Proteobacteria bacterium]|nr:MMPL family transporter [Pseudomonadota bacterium]MBU4036883.1 MMPL family transporter [Pseudomonadota bacterium]